jgi:hypothetical protein
MDRVTGKMKRNEDPEIKGIVFAIVKAHRMIRKKCVMYVCVCVRVFKRP